MIIVNTLRDVTGRLTISSTSWLGLGQVHFNGGDWLVRTIDCLEVIERHKENG